MTVMALAGEWQRDWARTDMSKNCRDFIQHFAGSGIAHWEQHREDPVDAGCRDGWQYRPGAAGPVAVDARHPSSVAQTRET